MKYVVVDDRTKFGKADIFVDEFESQEEAISWAEEMWNHKTTEEMDKCEYYVLESANPNEESEDHFDGDIVWMPTWYAVLMDEEDNDWGTGSHDKGTARDIAIWMGAKYVATIADGRDPICVEVEEVE